MTVTVIAGKTSKNHTSHLVNKLSTDAKQNKDKQFFVLVPNHIKFQSEKNIIERLAKLNNATDLYAPRNIEITSFNRFAWTMQQAQPNYIQLDSLSDNAMTMAIAQIILNSQNELKLFNTTKQVMGVAGQILNQLGRLKIANIGSNEFAEFTNQFSETEPSFNKYHDLSIIYQKFEDAMDGKFIQLDKTLTELNDILNKKSKIDYKFYISKFSQFSNLEWNIIETLIKKNVDIVIDLDLDQVSRPHGNFDLFKSSRNVFEKLKKLSTETGIKLNVEFVKENRTNEDLEILENVFVDSINGLSVKPTKLLDSENVTIVETQSKEDEINYVSSEIRDLVANKGYRYRDIAILTNNINSYENLFTSFFRKTDIPWFNDLQISMKDNAFFRTIELLFKIYENNFNQSDVISILKTGLLMEKDDSNTENSIDNYFKKVDQFENYVLKYRINHSDFAKKFDYDSVENDIQNELEQFRVIFNTKMQFLIDQFDDADTYVELTTRLYEFIKEKNIFDNSLKIAKRDKNKTIEMTYSEYEQIFNQFVSVLDDIVKIGDNSDFSVKNFQLILLSGLFNANFALIPQTLDQVTVSELGYVNPNLNKIVFIVGADENSIPNISKNFDILDNSDYEKLNQLTDDNQEISESVINPNYNNEFEAYSAFLSPSEQLHFSFVGNSEEQDYVKISPYVNVLKNALSLPIKKIDKAGFVPMSKPALLSYLVKQINDKGKSVENLSQNDKFLLSVLKDDHLYRYRLDLALKSLDFTNNADKISGILSKSLYGSTINTSVTRLQTFYENPYQYFLQFGLKLRPREIGEITPLNLGEFYHAALENFVNLINVNNLQIENISETEINEHINIVLQNMEDFSSFNFLKRDVTQQYLLEHFKKVIRQQINALIAQQKVNNFYPVKTELGFGLNDNEPDQLKPIVLETPKGYTVRLRGKIDRLDIGKIDNKTFYNVIDYKSGDKTFNNAEFFNGLNLQALTYVSAISNNKSKISPQGDLEFGSMMYEKIHATKVKYSEIGKHNLENLKLKTYKFSGIMVNNLEYLSNIDQEVSKGITNRSEVFPIVMKKDGSFKGPIYSESEINLMLSYNDFLIKSAADRIITGDISLSPSYFNGKSNVSSSEYQEIMRFNPVNRNNQYRFINPIENVEMIDKIKKNMSGE